MQDRYDLIERYLNGAADPAEAAELMQSLRNDPELMQEFEATARIKYHVAEDLAAIELPESVYTAITTDAAVSGVLPMAAQVAGSTLPLALITLSSLVVVAVTAVVFLSTSHLPPASELAAAIAPPSEHLDRVPMTPSEPHSNYGMVGPLETEEGAGSPVGKTMRAQQSMTPVETPSTPTSTSTDIVPITRVASMDRHRDAITRTTRASGEAPYLQASNTTMPTVKVRVLQRPVAAFSYDAGSTSGSLTSLSIEAEMEFADQQWIGAGYHRDLFPLVVKNADGMQYTQNYVEWFGAHYRWTPQMDLPLNMQPFFHMGVGGSASGLVVQPALGLSLPVSSLSIGVGLDAVGMAFQDKGSWNMAVSPALRFELGYRW